MGELSDAAKIGALAGSAGGVVGEAAGEAFGGAGKGGEEAGAAFGQTIKKAGSAIKKLWTLIKDTAGDNDEKIEGIMKDLLKTSQKAAKQVATRNSEKIKRTERICRKPSGNRNGHRIGKASC